jgi:hypothetical protein
VIAFGLGTLGLGIAAFFVWAKLTRRWPFAPEAVGGIHPPTGPAPGR